MSKTSNTIAGGTGVALGAAAIPAVAAADVEINAARHAADLAANSDGIKLLEGNKALIASINQYLNDALNKGATDATLSKDAGNVWKDIVSDASLHDKVDGEITRQYHDAWVAAQDALNKDPNNKTLQDAATKAYKLYEGILPQNPDGSPNTHYFENLRIAEHKFITDALQASAQAQAHLHDFGATLNAAGQGVVNEVHHIGGQIGNVAGAVGADINNLIKDIPMSGSTTEVAAIAGTGIAAAIVAVLVTLGLKKGPETSKGVSR